VIIDLRQAGVGEFTAMPPLGAAVIRAVALFDFPWGSAGQCGAGSNLAVCEVT
jgi:hypothetical protein